MQYKLLAVSALAAFAFAAPEKRQASNSEDIASIYSVIETAIPSSIIALASTNSAAASAEIASEFANGATPSWFAALPTNIQTYLIPAAPSSNSTIRGTGSSGFPSRTANSTGFSTTAAPTSNVATLTSIVGPPSTPAQATGTSRTSNGASVPTAIVGMGLAGAMGVLGVLAL